MSTEQHCGNGDRVLVLERSRARWRTIALALAALGTGFALGGMQEPPPRKLQAIVLDPTKSSGHWNSTLIAVDADGTISYLDTSRQVSEWKKHRFSPR